MESCGVTPDPPEKGKFEIPAAFTAGARGGLSPNVLSPFRENPSPIDPPAPSASLISMKENKNFRGGFRVVGMNFPKCQPPLTGLNVHSDGDEFANATKNLQSRKISEKEFESGTQGVSFAGGSELIITWDRKNYQTGNAETELIRNRKLSRKLIGFAMRNNSKLGQNKLSLNLII